MFENQSKIRESFRTWKNEYFLMSAFLIMCIIAFTIQDVGVRILSGLALFVGWIQYKKSLWMSVHEGTNPLLCFMNLLDSKKLILFNIAKWIVLCIPICFSMLSIVCFFIFSGIENADLYNLMVIILCTAACLLGILFFIYTFYSYRYTDYIFYEEPNTTLVNYLEESREKMIGKKWSILKMDIVFLLFHILSILTSFLGYIICLPYMTLTYNDWFHTNFH